MKAGNGSYRIVAGNGGQQVGSVMVHARGQSAIEVSDLGVDPAHRSQGLGGVLMASALRTGLQLGKSKVVLGSQDDGSGRLTRWYQRMGFTQVGINDRGFPQLEAPISRVLSSVAQLKTATRSPEGPSTRARSSNGAILPGIRSIQGKRGAILPTGSSLQLRSALGAQPTGFAPSPILPPRNPGRSAPRPPGHSRTLQRMEAEKPKTTAGHAQDFVILKNKFWIVKKVDKAEAAQYLHFHHHEKPEMVPAFYGPFDNPGDILEVLGKISHGDVTSEEAAAIVALYKSMGNGDQLLILANIGQGSGRPPKDLKLGIHTASATDQKNRGEGFFSRTWKITVHNFMDATSPSYWTGVRDEGEKGAVAQLLGQLQQPGGAAGGMLELLASEAMEGPPENLALG